jgi:hypothetical protein
MLPTAAQMIEKLPRFFRRHKIMTGWMELTGESPVQLVSAAIISAMPT